MCVVHDTLSWNAIATVDVEEQICNAKSACGKVSRIRHMVPGGSRESLPKRKARFADNSGVECKVPFCKCPNSRLYVHLAKT
jgi:hypothetical protein